MSGKIVIFAQVDNYIHMLILDKEIRPRQRNNSRDVENPKTRKTIEAIVLRYIKE